MTIVVIIIKNIIIYDRIAKTNIKFFKIEISQREIEIDFIFVKIIIKFIEFQIIAFTNNDRCKIIFSFTKKINNYSKLSTNLFNKQY